MPLLSSPSISQGTNHNTKKHSTAITEVSKCTSVTTCIVYRWPVKYHTVETMVVSNLPGR